MAEQYEGTLEKLKMDYALLPKEELADFGNKSKSLYIGIPDETNYNEKRIPLTPNSVEGLVNRGNRIVIESGAGVASGFSDQDYIQVGADIVFSKEEVFKASTIIKSTPINVEEIPLLLPNQVLVSPILLPKLNVSTLKHIIEKKVTALAFEYIKGDYDTYPFMRSMSEIAGNYAILTAAKYLSNEYGHGILLGGITGHPPTKVVILGAGSVGEAAARAALGLGARVLVFDDNISRLMRLQNDLGRRIYTSVIDSGNLRDKIARAHVVIGALKPINGKTPCVVTEDMVAGMKAGSVIIDVSIDHGGCFESSRVTDNKNPVFTKHGVVHYCVPNIASNVSRTASYALSNIITPFLKSASDCGGIENFIKQNAGFRHGTYLYKGSLTKSFLAEKFDLKFTNLELLLSVDF